MIFHTKQRQIHNYPNLYIDAKKVEFVKEFNFLGLLFDCNMSWKAHLNMISKKNIKNKRYTRTIKKFSSKRSTIKYI